jgi:hypothetical protein
MRRRLSLLLVRPKLQCFKKDVTKKAELNSGLLQKKSELGTFVAATELVYKSDKFRDHFMYEDTWKFQILPSLE